MRAGGCTVQQALTVEAANVVKQAVALARRRGHAQVTPLHVANTMLAASNGLLRTACLQSHSHPLQCKALELCFNVALNRLPASSSSSSLPTMLGHHHHHSQQQYPTISNALVAAFKRAQAHQRRGSIENQQQPLLAVKIELEQLIISILDDPSVSRVMREAGFSSSQVKNNVEQAVSSLELCSHQVPSTRNNNINNKSNIKENNLLHHVFPQPSTAAVAAESAEEKASKPSSAAAHDPTAASAVKDEDVLSVIDCLLTGRKRSIVVVGECLANIDGVVRGLMDKVNKGNVPEALKEVKFISIPLISFSHHRHREEVEQKIGELTCLVRGLMDKGVILYLGDLKWITDFIIMRSSSSSGDHEQGMMRRSYYNNCYCPVEHMITEFGRLLMSSSGMGENGKCWLMGIATFQTYMRCRSGSGSCHQRSLETLWGLHPITLPAGSLSLSLSTECGESRSKTAGNGSYNNQLLLIDSHSHDRGNEEMIQLNCCADCSAKFETEARSLQTRGISHSESALSSLPSWLKEESKRLKDNDQNCMPVRELCRKWNKVCSSSFHKQAKSSPTFSSSTTSPSSSTSFFSCYDQQLHSCSDDVVLQQQQQQQQQRFWAPTAQTQYEKNYCDDTTATTTSFRLYISEHSNSSSKEPKQVVSNSPLLSTTTSTPNSASSSDNNNNMMETELLYLPRFKEFNCENLNILCNALEQKVPWQKDVIPDIAGTILQCRSGMLRRKEKVIRNTGITDVKEETWLFFQGVDVQAKENIARELAKIIFGSYSKFISVALSSFSSYSTSEDMIKNKRSRDELHSSSYLERLAQAISEDPHRVFFVEDVEQADLCSRVGIKRAIQRGRISSGGGGDDQEVSLSDAIIILSCESFNCRSRACSPPVKHKSSDSLEDAEEEISPCVSLDLNLSFDDDDDDDHGDDDCSNNSNESIDDVGILENVDRRIVFRMREL